jgi:hypothetical protein
MVGCLSVQGGEIAGGQSEDILGYREASLVERYAASAAPPTATDSVSKAPRAVAEPRS